jgi:hypothetical protein
MKGQEELLQNVLTSLLAIKAAQSVYGPRSGEQSFETELGHSCLFSTGYRLVLETTQPPSIQWVTERGGGLSWMKSEGCETHLSLQSSTNIRDAWSCTSTPHAESY